MAPAPSGDAAGVPLGRVEGPDTSAAASLVAIDAVGATPGFTTRRVANPKFKPPLAQLPTVGPGAAGRLRALEHAHAQWVHLGAGQPGSTTLWEISAGELYQDQNALDLALSGGRRGGVSRLHGLTLAAKRDAWSGTLGDADGVFQSRGASLQRLRGAVLRYGEPGKTRWLALGGIPRPLPDQPTPRLLLGGAVMEDARFDEAWLSAAAFGFSRRESDARLVPATPGDTLPGSGAMGSLGWRVPLGPSHLTGRLGAQAHGLEGRRSLGIQHGLQWNYQSRTLVVSLSDERATRSARTLGTDRIGLAPRRENRLNLQTRFAGGRAESHVTGIVTEGGDPLLEARVMQLGGSGNLGRSPWYVGGDAVWDRRPAFSLDERRLSLHAGGLLGNRHALLGRVESALRPAAADALTALAEASLSLARGMRLGLEPRFGWHGGMLDRGDFTARLSVPAAWLSSRLTGALSFGASRDEAFRGRVSEVSLAVSLSPTPRDRADVEARRLDQQGRPWMEYSASWDLRRERYDRPGWGWLGARDTGWVVVRVVRSGNRRGVADVLVSLDGSQLRFTDADGVARFDRVPPGVHVAAIEERSLPENHEVVSTSRAFVTVERGRPVDPVEFTIARRERRIRF